MNARQTQAHENAIRCASAYKRCEAELLQAIDEAERCRLFECFKLSSIYAYCIGALGLTESVAYYFITVARKSRKIPALREAIEAGELSVPKAARVCGVLTEENQTDWIPKAQTLSKNALEREVAKVSPTARKRDTATSVDEDAVRMALTVSSAFMRKLERVRELEAQRTRKASAMAESLEAALDDYLTHHDPVLKAERSKPRKPSSSARAESIPAAARHAVFRRDRGECQADVDGAKCAERKWIEIHHIKPRAEGGTHEPENLTTLCGFHHRLLHEEREP